MAYPNRPVCQVGESASFGRHLRQEWPHFAAHQRDIVCPRPAASACSRMLSIASARVIVPVRHCRRAESSA